MAKQKHDRKALALGARNIGAGSVQAPKKASKAKGKPLALVPAHCGKCLTEYFRTTKVLGEVEKCGVCLAEGALVAGKAPKKAVHDKNKSNKGKKAR